MRQYEGERFVVLPGPDYRGGRRYVVVDQGEDAAVSYHHSYSLAARDARRHNFLADGAEPIKPVDGDCLFDTDEGGES